MSWFFIVIMAIVGIAFIAIGVTLLRRLYEKKPQSQSERTKEIYDKLSTEISPPAAEHQIKLSQAREAFSNQINSEAASYAVKGKIEAEAEVAAVKRETETLTYKTKQLELEAHQELINRALRGGWDVKTYLEIEKMTKVQQLTLEQRWQEKEQDLKGGFIFQLQAHQQLTLISEYIGGLYDRAERLEKEGKHREKKLIEKHITFMENDFYGRQRLLQAAEQEDDQGSDEDTDLR